MGADRLQESAYIRAKIAQEKLIKFIRQGLRARNDPREVVADSNARYFGAKLSELTLVASGEAHIGEIRFEDWLSPAMPQR